MFSSWPYSLCAITSSELSLALAYTEFLDRFSSSGDLIIPSESLGRRSPLWAIDDCPPVVMERSDRLPANDFLIAETDRELGNLRNNGAIQGRQAQTIPTVGSSEYHMIAAKAFPGVVSVHVDRRYEF